MKKLSFPIVVSVLAAAILCVAACTDDKSKTHEWEWESPETETPGENPGEGDNSGENPGEDTPVAQGKPFYIWIDAAANFPDFANSKEKIVRDLTLAKDTGFTDVVVDVRPTTGNVLFKSRRGTTCEWLGAWVGATYSKIERTADWDYLEVFIEEGHKLGLRVHAAMNTMVGGRKTSLGASGILYEDPSKKSWQTYLNLKQGITPATEYSGSDACFFNPANDEVVEYLVSLVEDLASYEGLDGIILDRCRYNDLLSDFSDISKEKFMDYIGVISLQWPDDILPAGTTYSTQPSTKPRYYMQWLEFRAKTIHDFVEKASDAAHSKNPDIKFGVYVGGWYGQYYDVGVNWAGPGYNTSAYYSWASANYKNYGYADHCDHMLIGAYANPGAVYGTTEWTMQGFCSQAKSKIGSACSLVCGGPDVGNWDSADNYTQQQENDAITNSVKACYDACDGYFLFDMIHLKKADQWRFVKKGIDEALGK